MLTSHSQVKSPGPRCLCVYVRVSPEDLFLVLPECICVVSVTYNHAVEIFNPYICCSLISEFFIHTILSKINLPTVQVSLPCGAY